MNLTTITSKLTWRRIVLGVLILLFIAGGASAYYFGDQYVTRTQANLDNLKTEQTKLYEQLQAIQTTAAADKKTLEDALKTNQDKIVALEAKLADLEKKVAANNLRAPSPTTFKTTSVYDRIITDTPAAKQKLTDALKLIETNAPYYFQIIKAQVQEIRTTSNIGCGGGQQVKRTVYISFTAGNCLSDTPTSIFASVLVHESYHVYNVYVNKVTTSGKAQELPSLYAQRATVDALGVTQSFRDYVEAVIAYYEAQ